MQIHNGQMMSQSYFADVEGMHKRKQNLESLEDFIRFANVHGRAVLDAGCGIGLLSKRLGLDKNQVVGIDINLHMLQYSKNEIKFGDILRASIYEIPIKSKEFDCVFLSNVMEHLERPLEALKEIRRMLKPSGVLFLSTPNGALYNLKKLVGKVYKRAMDRTHIHEFIWKELRTLVEKGGFQIVEVQSSGVPVVNKMHHKASRKIAHGVGKRLFPWISSSFWLKLRKTDFETIVKL